MYGKGGGMMCDVCIGSMIYGFVMGLIMAWFAGKLFRKREIRVIGLDGGCGGNCTCKVVNR